MNQQEFLNYHKECIDLMHDICKKKNSDYCGGTANNNAFKNFELVEQFDVTTTEIGIFTRLLDKLSRLASYIKVGDLQVKDESVKDTLLDAANYCILLAAYLESKKEAITTELYYTLPLNDKTFYIRSKLLEMGFVYDIAKQQFIVRGKDAFDKYKSSFALLKEVNEEQLEHIYSPGYENFRKTGDVTPPNYSVLLHDVAKGIPMRYADFWDN